MRTVRSSPYGRSHGQRPLWTETPRQRPLDSLDRDPLNRDPPVGRPPPSRQTPPGADMRVL